MTTPVNDIKLDYPLIELHSHLGGCISAETLILLAQQDDAIVLPSYDREILSRYLVAQSKSDFFRILNLTKPIRNNSNNWSVIARHEFRRAHRMGVIYAEYRFGSARLLLGDEKYLLATLSSINKEQKYIHEQTGMQVQLIWGINRSEHSIAHRVIPYIIELWQDKWIAGVDLNGDETICNTKNFIPIFNRLRREGIPITIHAGEWSGTDSIWAALQAGAQRIGHATRAIDDPNLMDHLYKNHIILEICPSSEISTGVIDSIHQHPVKQFLDKGLKVTINSDDPPLFNTTILKEYKLIIDTFQLTKREFLELILNSVEGAFVDQAAKRKLLRHVLGFESTQHLK